MEKRQQNYQSSDAKVQELELKLAAERKLNEDKTALMEKTISETEDLARHLQNTTLALIQERQIANSRAEKEKLINKWVELINSAFYLDGVLDLTTKEIGSYLGVDRCGIVLFSRNALLAVNEYAELEYKRNFVTNKNIEETSIQLRVETVRKNYYIRKAIKSKTNIIETKIGEKVEDNFLHSTQSLLALPILIKKQIAGTVAPDNHQSLIDEIQGVFYVQQCSEVRDWNEREIDLLQSIVIPLSTAIEKALLYQEARKRTEYAELLNNLTTQIRSSLNLSEILARTVNELGLALKASRCFLYFDGYISDEYCEQGVHSIANTATHLILDNFRKDQFGPIAVNDLLAPENFSRLTAVEQEELIATGAVSALACPLHFQSVVQGWIVFHSYGKRSWIRDEMDFVEAAGSQVIVAMTQSRMYEKLNSYQEKLSRELKQAARVQTSLIGGDVFNVNLETSVFYKAHSNVSGDFYWVAELSPDKVGVLIGDVSGKGPAAALLTGYLLGEFNSAVRNSALAWFPEKMISFLCQSILDQNASSDFYATAWYGVFDLYEGSLTYTNAGHLNPYLIQGDKIIIVDKDQDSGVPLGLINPKEIDEVYEAKTIDFKQGDKMILFTDGVMDQKMPDGNFVPKDWVMKVLEQVKGQDVKEITYELNEALNTLSGATPLTDDRLMISLEQVKFDIVDFDAQDTKKVASLIDTVVTEALAANMPAERGLDLRLGITEAMTNAIRYGLQKNPYGTVRLGYRINPGSFKMTLIDPGPGFNWQVYNQACIDDVTMDNEGGRGIPLLLEIFDKVTWNYLGNHIGLFYYW
ncbi:MAG: SpoIIE family protein phosphatase [Cyanobacteria bacterium]|nr:SpoIIE family protein phosphatase [Cyanobacteriota bacterium]